MQFRGYPMQLIIPSGSGGLALIFFVCLAVLVMCRSPQSLDAQTQKKDDSKKAKDSDQHHDGSINDQLHRRNPYAFIKFKSRKVSKISRMA
jgi:hypothetical protein